MAVTHALIDLAPLRASAQFRRLWIGQAVSGFGSQLTYVAVLYQVWRTTGSPVWTGAVGLAQAIPLICLGLFAGSLIDRTDRRQICLIATIGQALSAIALAGQGRFGHLPVLGLLLLVAAQSGFGAAGGPAARTFVPRLLPADQVAAGLALQRITFQAAMLVGPAVGGLLIASVGVGGCYLVDALSFGVAFYGVLGLPPMWPEGEPSRPGLDGVLEGLGFLLHNPVVRAALLTDLATTVLSFPISLFPLINAERFDGSPRSLGLFLSAIALGGVLASVFSGTFTRLEQHGPVMLVASAGWGLSLVLLGLTSSPWLALCFLVLAGIADTVAVVLRSTIVALHTPDALRGRVAAAEQIIGHAGPDLGNLRGGLVAGATSAPAALISGGLMCISAVALISTTMPGPGRFSRGKALGVSS